MTHAEAASGHPQVGPGLDGPTMELRLYVAGQTLKSLKAIANLRRLCEEYLEVRFLIEVIDLLESPQRASGDQIVAIPTLVRKHPTPMRKIIGDLSNLDRVFIGLELRPPQRKDN